MGKLIFVINNSEVGPSDFTSIHSGYFSCGCNKEQAIKVLAAIVFKWLVIRVSNPMKKVPNRKCSFDYDR